MKWIKSFLGLNDKEQIARTHEVTELVKEKRGKFKEDLNTLKTQAQKIRTMASQTSRESAKLVIMAADITTKIAIVSGGIRLDK